MARAKHRTESQSRTDAPNHIPPNAVWSDDDLRKAKSDTETAVLAAIQLVEIAKQQELDNDQSDTAIAILTANTRVIVNNAQLARDAIRTVAAELIRVRAAMRTPVPCYSGCTDAFAVGAAAAFVFQVTDYFYSPRGTNTRVFYVGRRDSPDAQCKSDMIGCRQRLATLTPPSLDQVRRDIAEEIGTAVRLRAIHATPDTKTDKPRKIRALSPENPDVAKLAKKIVRESSTGATKIDIARDFANGDEKKAQSLLRQLRGDRYKNLLDAQGGY